MWRFAFGLAVSNTEGELKLIEEVFSQRETLEQRARKIHNVMMKNGVPDGTLIWGDCANPQDILELNLAFQRMGSPYHVKEALNRSAAGGDVDRCDDAAATAWDVRA